MPLGGTSDFWPGLNWWGEGVGWADIHDINIVV